jgi:hypothetical protein
MKKKTKHKPVKKSKQKIDVVLESLLNLEKQVKELIKEVNQLKNKNHHYYPPYQPPKDDNEYWPNTQPPFKYKDVTWGIEQKTQPFFVKHDSN